MRPAAIVMSNEFHGNQDILCETFRSAFRKMHSPSAFAPEFWASDAKLLAEEGVFGDESGALCE